MTNILVIDDNADMRYLLENLLSTNGFTVNLAKDSEEAFSCFDKSIPDLVILDLRLPKMNGIEILKKIRERDIVSKVIILTAYSNLDNRNKAIQYGADGYLTKPFDNNELLANIYRILDLV